MPPESHETCWTVLHAAAHGDAEARSAFARRYEPTIRGYLEIRWRNHVLMVEIDDGTQEVFVECLKPGGVLKRVEWRLLHRLPTGRQSTATYRGTGPPQEFEDSGGEWWLSAGRRTSRAYK